MVSFEAATTAARALPSSTTMTTIVSEISIKYFFDVFYLFLLLFCFSIAVGRGSPLSYFSGINQRSIAFNVEQYYRSNDTVRCWSTPFDSLLLRSSDLNAAVEHCEIPSQSERVQSEQLQQQYTTFFRQDCSFLVSPSLAPSDFLHDHPLNLTMRRRRRPVATLQSTASTIKRRAENQTLP